MRRSSSRSLWYVIRRRNRILRLLSSILVISSCFLIYLIISDRTLQPYRYHIPTTRRAIPPSSEAIEKWIVLTSDDVSLMEPDSLVGVRDWHVLVVGDSQLSPACRLPMCEYLNTKHQTDLDLKMTSKFLKESWSKKAIGYLHAIYRGAKFIYETDGTHRILGNLSGFTYKPKTSGLMYEGRTIFNPYPHFGQSKLRPRGFPMLGSGAHPSNLYRLSEQWDTPTIQQGLASGHMDMARLFQPIHGQPSPVQHVTFDPAAPPVLVPREVFSPLNFRNVLYHRSSFWALFAPTSKDRHTSGLVHRLSCQKLLWEIGGRVGFFALDDVEISAVKPSQSPISGSTDEFVQGLISYLTEWSCPKTLTFFQCVVKLSKDLAAREFWTSRESQVMMVWVEDLIHIGYTQPQRKRHADEFQFYFKRTLRVGYRDDNKFEPDRKKMLITRVSYAPLEQAPPAPFKKPPSRSQISRQASKITAMCSNVKLHEQGTTYAEDSDKTTFFHDILLIVVYNHFYYNNTLYLDTIHRTMFRHIVYCGESLAKFQKETKDNGTQLTFIETSVFLGFNAYHCVIKAMQMGYKVKGYLLAGDDVMFKPWTLLKADKNKIWVTDEGGWFGMKKSEATSRWIWWGMSIGREAYLKTLADLRNTKEFPKGVRPWQELQNNMAAHTGSDNVTEIRLSDLFYIPSRLIHEACWYLTRFLQHNVYLEIAVPAVLRGLGARDIHYIHGKSLWMEERRDTFRFYYRVESFFHPAKFSSNAVRAGYCQLYFPDLLNYIFGYKRRFLYAIT